MVRLATTNEVLSSSGVVSKMGSASVTGKSANAILNQVSQRAAEPSQPDNRGVNPVILVRHRWFKGRSITVNDTLLAFGMDGIARVPDWGYARLAVDQFIQRANGAARIVTPESLTTEPFDVEEPAKEVVPLQELLGSEEEPVAADTSKIDESFEAITEAPADNDAEDSEFAVLGDGEDMAQESIVPQEPAKKKTPPKGRKF